MINHSLICPQCSEELKSGEKLIVINDLTYHPECYRKELEQGCQGFSLTREINLSNMVKKVEVFSAFSNPNLLKDSTNFVYSLVNQYAVLSDMNSILDEAKIYSVLSWVDRAKLKRKIENSRNRIDEAEKLYKDWLLMTLELKKTDGHIVEVFPNNKSSEALKKEAQKYLVKVADNIKQISILNQEIIHSLSMLSEKMAKMEVQRMNEQIDRIPKDLQTL